MPTHVNVLYITEVGVFTFWLYPDEAQVFNFESASDHVYRNFTNLRVRIFVLKEFI